MKCYIGLALLVFLSLGLAQIGCEEIGTADRDEPPPQSSPAVSLPAKPVIRGVAFDWNSHRRHAPGSDNWPITWAADDNQYTTWGDGGGFGGTNSAGRVSLGVARITDSSIGYEGHNIFGGYGQEQPTEVTGKSYGILSLDDRIYMWVSPGSGTDNYLEARLYHSTDQGASWSAADWSFPQEAGLILPTFLQCGRDYGDARDDYVYIYASELKQPESLCVQIPGEIALLRVTREEIQQRSAYQFFAGFDGAGIPRWEADLTLRQPVFTDSNGVGWNVSAAYNSGQDRYLLITEHGSSARGRIGIFDAPAPWGPWASIHYADSFGDGIIEQTTFFWNFSPKWFYEEGRRFVLIFTGVRSNDSWNSVAGEFLVGDGR